MPKSGMGKNVEDKIAARSIVEAKFRGKSMDGAAEIARLKKIYVEKSIKILIADSHPVVRGGIENLLRGNDSFSFAGHAKNSSELFAILRDVDVDILITEYLMSDEVFSDGAVMLERLRRMHPLLKIIVFTSVKDAGIIKLICKYKLQGILLKDSEFDEINLAVKRVAFGGRYFCGKLRSIIDQDDSKVRMEGDMLSLREAEILRMFLSGMAMKDIAAKTHKSIKTVSNQKQSAFRKLGCRNNAEIFRLKFMARNEFYTHMPLDAPRNNDMAIDSSWKH